MTSKKKLTILCDMDSIVVDIQGPWLARYNERYGTSFTVDDITDWNWGGPKFMAILSEPGFFRDLPSIPGAQAALRMMLADGHDVFLATACGPAAASDKISWVREYAPFMKDRMFLAEGRTPKHVLKGDVLIDDAPHNIEGFKQDNPTGLAITIEYPYNAHIAVSHVRAGSYKEPIKTWGNIVETVRNAQW